jgi:predicted RNA-binding protein with RPS1 domain
MSTENGEGTKQAEVETAEELDPQEIKNKMQFSGKVRNITLAGAIVDIGLDQPGMLHISRLQKESVNKVEDVLETGQEIDVWIRRVDPKSGRIELTMIEPLALEWREIKKGMVVKGRIERIENFGAFVEIGAERPGLVHISEITHGYIRTPNEVLKAGEEVDVKVIGVNRRKKRIRLSMKALEVIPEKQKPTKKQKVTQAPEQEEEEKPVPTAMEIAMREAMERSKTQEKETAVVPQSPEPKPSKSKDELDDILNRTLEHEVSTS